MKMYTLKEAAKIFRMNETSVRNRVFISKTIRSQKIQNIRYISEREVQRYKKVLAQQKQEKPKKASAVQIKNNYREIGRRMAHVERGGKWLSPIQRKFWISQSPYLTGSRNIKKMRGLPLMIQRMGKSLSGLVKTFAKAVLRT